MIMQLGGTTTTCSGWFLLQINRVHDASATLFKASYGWEGIGREKLEQCDKAIGASGSFRARAPLTLVISGPSRAVSSIPSAGGCDGPYCICTEHGSLIRE